MTRRPGPRAAIHAVVCLVIVLSGAATPVSAQSTPSLGLLGTFDFDPPPGGVVKLLDARVDGEDRVLAYAAGGIPGSNLGLRVIDVTDPAAPSLVRSVCLGGYYEGSIDLRSDLGLLVAEGGCGMASASSRVTFFDVSDPVHPTILSTVDTGADVHGVTFHPTKPVVYVSRSLSVGVGGEIPIIDVADPASPRLAELFDVFPQAAHAISFNASGTRAYAASRSHTHVLDTSDPLAPQLLASIHDPSVKSHSWARATPNGSFLAVGDLMSATSDPCPASAVHFYDLRLGVQPVKVGAFVAPESDSTSMVCATMYFDFDPITGLMAVPREQQGTFLLNVSDPTGLGARAVARTDTGTPWNAHSSTFHGGRLYSVDISRGLDILELPQRFDMAGSVAPNAPFEWRGIRAVGANVSTNSPEPARCGKDVDDYCDRVWIHADPITSSRSCTSSRPMPRIEGG